MEYFKNVVVVVFIIFSVARAVPEYHRVEAHYGGDITAFQDIMVDEEELNVVVTVSKISSRKVTPSINLHDFTVGFSAIKNVEQGTCYIEKTRHTFNQMKSEVKRAKQNDGHYEVGQWFTCTSKTFVAKSQMLTYGERIAAFCAEYESIFTERTYTNRNRRSLDMFAENALGCFICAGFC
ncbi:uncharacterized protein LOC128546872 [Mercenaria mercenaria]|uniref:uncharacterized protein LOC128546872 n=1 Tax=Mercenaria mercenaria TaxID=6596 RepID=UPI00234F1357|nr:uncharacterized protein LOC128546872 [Mercenaria mercenaria]